MSWRKSGNYIKKLNKHVANLKMTGLHVIMKKTVMRETSDYFQKNKGVSYLEMKDLSST